MLTGADDLLATARDAQVIVSASIAEQAGITDGAIIDVEGENATLRLSARVSDAVADGAIVVPTNSTDTPVGAIAGRDGVLQVELRVAAPDEEVA